MLGTKFLQKGLDPSVTSSNPGGGDGFFQVKNLINDPPRKDICYLINSIKMKVAIGKQNTDESAII